MITKKFLNYQCKFNDIQNGLVKKTFIVTTKKLKFNSKIEEKYFKNIVEVLIF